MDPAPVREAKKYLQKWVWHVLFNSDKSYNSRLTRADSGDAKLLSRKQDGRKNATRNKFFAAEVAGGQDGRALEAGLVKGNRGGAIVGKNFGLQEDLNIRQNRPVHSLHDSDDENGHEGGQRNFDAASIEAVVGKIAEIEFAITLYLKDKSLL